MWMLALAVLIAATPLRLTLTLRQAQRFSLTVRARVWGVSFRLTLPPGDAQIRRGRLRRGLAVLGALLRGDRARRLLLRGVTLEELTVRARFGLSGAHRTALATAALRSAASLLPPAWQGRLRLNVTPDFFRDETSVHVRCILFTRLGTLLVTAAMLLTAWMLEKREHRPAKEAKA